MVPYVAFCYSLRYWFLNGGLPVQAILAVTYLPLLIPIWLSLEYPSVLMLSAIAAVWFGSKKLVSKSTGIKLKSV